jgi:hypothetical protein
MWEIGLTYIRGHIKIISSSESNPSTTYAVLTQFICTIVSGMRLGNIQEGLGGQHGLPLCWSCDLKLGLARTMLAAWGTRGLYSSPLYGVTSLFLGYRSV